MLPHFEYSPRTNLKFIIIFQKKSLKFKLFYGHPLMHQRMTCYF